MQMGCFDTAVLSRLIRCLIAVFLLVFVAETPARRPGRRAARGWGMPAPGRCLGQRGAVRVSSPDGGNKTPQLFVQLGCKLRFLPAQLIA